MFGWYSLPDYSGLVDYSCSVGKFRVCPHNRGLWTLLVLAGHPAEAPVRSPERPSAASPPGAHPELHYSPGELSRGASGGVTGGR